MSANPSETPQSSVPVQPDPSSRAPKRVTNAQTVCNEKNEKGKLCNGHLKQLRSGGEQAEKHLRGDDVLFKCQVCGTLYMGPPLGHVRDPDKQQRFVERELTAILQAAGGSLPAFKKSASGAWVPVEDHGHHAPAPAKPSTPAKPATPGQKPATETKAAPKETAAAAKPAAQAKATVGYVPPPAPGPVPGETHEQKLVRLRAIVAEAKRRKEAADAGEALPDSTLAEAAPAASQALPPQTPPAPVEAPINTEHAAATPPKASAAAKTPAAAAPMGPVPGETHEQKIARLKAVINAALAKEGKPPKY
jgi:hypothetical protein